MLSIGDFSASRALPRRPFLRVGAAGLGGLLSTFGAARFPPLPAAAAEPVRRFLRDRAVIFLFMHGGPSQFETFDPKTAGPPAGRSATGEIATSIPGIAFGSTFAELARRAHLLTIVRSFVPGDGNHDIKPVLGKATDKAAIGSLYARVAGPLRPATAMPTNVTLFPQAVVSEALPPVLQFGDFTSAGDLGAAFAPVVPGAKGGLQEDMRLHVPQDRLGDRRGLLEALDRGRRWLDLPAVRDLGGIERSAFDVLLRGVGDAFDVDREDPRLVARYDTAPLFRPEAVDTKWNNHRNYVDHGRSLGRLLLLARRLCERGAGFVTVTTSFVWDMHADVNNAPMVQGMEWVGRPFDHAVSALIDDIESRGLRDKILLVCCGEMGRTPQLNKGGGRDHWGGLGPLMLYGGGLPTGAVVGRSTRDGGHPEDNPVHIPDLIATIMNAVFDLGEVRLLDGLPKPLLARLAEGRAIGGPRTG